MPRCGTVSGRHLPAVADGAVEGLPVAGKSESRWCGSYLSATMRTLVLVREPPDKRAAGGLWHLRYLHDWNSNREQPVPRALVFEHDHPVQTGALAARRIASSPAMRVDRRISGNAKDGRSCNRFRHGKTARGAAFPPDEARIVTWGEGGVKLWDVKTGKETAT